MAKRRISMAEEWQTWAKRYDIDGCIHVGSDLGSCIHRCSGVNRCDNESAHTDPEDPLD